MPSESCPPPSRHNIFQRQRIELPVVQIHFLSGVEMHVRATRKVARLSLMLMPADSCERVSLSHFLFRGDSDIGSCPARFLSPELGEELTLCLPDTETSCTGGGFCLAQELETRGDVISGRSPMKIPTITQSRSAWHN